MYTEGRQVNFYLALAVMAVENCRILELSDITKLVHKSKSKVKIVYILAGFHHG